MLVDEPLVAVFSNDPILRIIGDGGGTIHVQRGIYEISHYGSSAFLRGYYEQYPENLSEHEDAPYLGCYGVCDGVENFLAVYDHLDKHPTREFVVTLKRVLRDVSNKGRGGGWRWHKWGAYIGTKEPTTEYLDDEPEIDQVFVYHIYEKEKNVNHE